VSERETMAIPHVYEVGQEGERAGSLAWDALEFASTS